jgi:hypothetical protein
LAGVFVGFIFVGKKTCFKVHTSQLQDFIWTWMEHFPCALHGNGDGSPQELQDAQLLPPNSAEYQA